jgi:hypothetical protein
MRGGDRKSIPLGPALLISIGPRDTIFILPFASPKAAAYFSTLSTSSDRSPPGSAAQAAR